MKTSNVSINLISKYVNTNLPGTAANKKHNEAR